ncbi:multiheme c-type cytochrome [Deferrisoma palaeochoriense]
MRRFTLVLALVFAVPAFAAEPVFYPKILNTTTGLPATPGQFTSADTCGYCHPVQYEQWRGSMHANALADPLYRALWREASRDTAGATDRFCAGCHAPVGALTEQVWIRDSGEIVIDPRADEGVTCDFCHSVVGVKLLEKGGNPGNSGLAVEPEGPKRGPYADAHSSFHATAYSDIHTQSEFCGACHNVFHPVNETEIARTYEEWKRSEYARAGIQCQDCHMVPPEVAARVADTLEKAVRRGLTSSFDTVRSPFFDHDFTGANAAIPTLLNHWRHANDARLRLQSAARLRLELPDAAAPGRVLEVAVGVENARAGHNLPTSMTELREMWLEVVVEDLGREGAVVFRSGGLDDRGRRDPAARRFGARAVDAEGRPTWKPWRIAAIADDTSIPPRSTRTERYEIGLPDDAQGPFRVTARLLYRSLPQEVADEYLDRPGWRVPLVEMAAAEGEVGAAR